MSATSPAVVYDRSYPPPRGPVLLLSCMDLRLLDQIVAFMNHDNLSNRYDHVVFAGAALGALGAPGAKDEHGQPIDCSYWQTTFKDHLKAAVELHGIEDIYILEHRNCGAYSNVFHVCPEFGDSKKERRKEAECHLKYAELLEQAIHDWAKEHNRTLRTHKFLMNLRGDVAVLKRLARETSPDKGAKPSKRAKTSAKAGKKKSPGKSAGKKKK